MKRLLSLILSAILCASALASCAAPTSPSASSSSDAEAYLRSRIGDGADDCILASGDDAVAKYADLVSFRDDGYVIRRIGDQTAILAKTDDGLDRGVRYYVNHFAASDETYYAYGEGYRVKSLSVAGRDIADYVIRLAPDADYCHNYAASELQAYIEKTCGAHLDIVTSDAPHMIVLDRVMDDDPRFADLGYEGFTLEVASDGNLWIHGGEDRGCLHGVYKLLTDYVGWRFYYDDRNMDASTHSVEFLYEADSVDIPAGLNDTQVPSFPFRQLTRCVGSDMRPCENYPCFFTNRNLNGYHMTRAASHGIIEAYEQFYDDTSVRQPCFTDEDFVEFCKDYYRNQIDAALAAGQVIGRDLTYIDVAQHDTMSFCTCKNCTKLYKQDGYYTGAVLDFTNKMADMVAEEYSPEIYVLMLVYSGTTAPPKVTMPRPNVSGAYCYYNDVDKYCCYAHGADGEECRHNAPANPQVKNHTYADELSRWCEICTRMLVWYYPGNWYYDALAVPDSRTLYDDMRFFYECGVYGVYNCPSGCFTGYSATGTRPEDLFMSYVISQLGWNCDMTREEYDAMVYEFLGFTCGKDSAPYIADWYALRERWARDDCWTTHAWSNPDEILIFDQIRDDGDLAISLFDSAIALAESADAEDLMTKMSLTTLYSVLVASHTDHYISGDSAQKAHYTEIYNKLNALIKEKGFNVIGYDYKTAITELPEIGLNPGSAMTVTYRAKADWWNRINGDLRPGAVGLPEYAE